MEKRQHTGNRTAAVPWVEPRNNPLYLFHYITVSSNNGQEDNEYGVKNLCDEIGRAHV
jgi:hypothetical protein